MRRVFFVLIASLAASCLVAGAAYAKDPKDPKKARKQITEAYECFLNGSLGYTFEQKAECVDKVADDEELLQLGNEIQAAQAANASQAAVKINKIKFKSEKKANVDFDLVIAGQLLKDVAPPGEAVLVKEGKKSVWKVSAVTFCDLSSLARPDALTGACADIL